MTDRTTRRQYERTTRRQYLRTAGATVTGGAALASTDREIAGVTAAQQTGPAVEASDSEITLSNSAVSVTLNRSDFDDKKQVICSAVGTEPGENLTGQLYSRYKSPISRTKSPRAELRELRGFGIAEQSSSRVAYQTVADYTVFGDSESDPHPIEVSYRVTLQEDDPFVLIDHRIENTGDGEIRIDQDNGDIHDGMQVHADFGFESPTGEYGYALSNGRQQSFADARKWNPQGAAQWGTVYDGSRIVTLGYLSGTTEPKMWITSGSSANHLDFLVGEVTLAAGESVTYRTAVAAQSVGSDPAQQGQDVVSTASQRADGTDQRFAAAESLSTQSGLNSGSGADEDDGGIPVLNRFGDDDTSLGLGLGVLGALGVGMYAMARRRDSDQQPRQRGTAQHRGTDRDRTYDQQVEGPNANRQQTQGPNTNRQHAQDRPRRNDE